jgi:RNA polymerase sigma-70 factor (ECF subfamily)
VTQLTFIRLWEFRHTLSEDYSIETQLFTIARTTLFNYLRKITREARTLDAAILYKTIAPDITQSSGQLLETIDQLNVAIESLPPVRKKVFLLSRLHGLSNKEIAGSLSISVKTVEYHISKAIHHLRSVLTLTAVAILTLY